MKINPEKLEEEIELIIPEEGIGEKEERKEGGKENDLPEELPILPIRESVLYPKMLLPLMVTQERLIKLIEAALVANKKIGIVALRRKEAEEVKPEDLFEIGCGATILKMVKMPDNSLRLLIQGSARIRLAEITQREPFIRAKIVPLRDEAEKMPICRASWRRSKGIFQKVVEMAPNLPGELAIMAMNIEEPGALADLIASTLNFPFADKQEHSGDPERQGAAGKGQPLLSTRSLPSWRSGSKIQTQVREGIDKSQREYYLREQLKAIQKELGEKDERAAEIEELRKRLIEAKLPAEAKKEGERELDRLAKMSPAAPEYTVARTYLDWLIELPWSVATPDNLDIPQAQKVLDQDHFDLEKVKKRILEYLAVRKLKADMKGPILCFVGPPGTGKTSVGKSIAKALGRKFIRMSLGGVRDEAEIRGHRRTYVGALPGRIIQGIRKAGSNNPGLHAG